MPVLLTLGSGQYLPRNMWEPVKPVQKIHDIPLDWNNTHTPKRTASKEPYIQFRTDPSDQRSLEIDTDKNLPQKLWIVKGDFQNAVTASYGGITPVVLLKTDNTPYTMNEVYVENRGQPNQKVPLDNFGQPFLLADLVPTYETRNKQPGDEGWKPFL